MKEGWVDGMMKALLVCLVAGVGTVTEAFI